MRHAQFPRWWRAIVLVTVAVLCTQSTAQAATPGITYIPGVANTPGINGTIFQTDVMVRNLRAEARTLTVSFHRFGDEAPATKEIRINGYETLPLANIVGTLFGATSVGGALAVSPDDDLVFQSRTANIANTSGTYGTSPRRVTGRDLILPGETVYLPGVMQSPNGAVGHRTNFGLILLPHSRAEVILFAANGQELGRSTRTSTTLLVDQRAITGYTVVQDIPLGWVEVHVERGAATAYLSVVDNVTGDGTMQQPQRLPLRVEPQIINGAAHAPGSFDTFWDTEVLLLNPTAVPATATFTAQNVSTALTRSTFTVDLPPHALLRIPSIYGDADAFGALEHAVGSATIAPSAPLVFSAITRTTPPAGGTGSYAGEQVPAPLTSLLTNARLGSTIIGLRATTAFRTNIRFHAGAEPATGTARLLDFRGTVVSSAPVELAAYGWKQLRLSQLFPGSIPAQSSIDLEVSSGAVHMEASIIDNDSGDPTVVPHELFGADPGSTCPLPVAELTFVGGDGQELCLGQSGLLRWHTEHASSVRISGLGEVGASGVATITPETTTAYRLEAVSACGVATAIASAIVLDGAPRFVVALATPTPIDVGGSSTIRWDTVNASSVTIDSLGTFPASGSISVSPPRTTTYTLRAHGACGNAVTTVTVEVTGTPCTSTATATLHSTTDTICPGESSVLTVDFTGSAPFTLTWSDGYTQTATGMSATRTVRPFESTHYTLTDVRDSKGCLGTVSGRARVIVDDCGSCDIPPTATVSGSTTIQAGQSATIAVTLTGTAPWLVTWSDGFTQTTSSNTATRIVSPATTTTYSVPFVRDGRGCTNSGSGSATITVVPVVCTQPTGVLTGSTTITVGQSAVLSVTLTGTAPWTLTWSDGVTQTANASPATRTVTPASTTTYTVVGLTDGQPCSGTVTGSATVTVNPVSCQAPPSITSLTASPTVINAGQSSVITLASLNGVSAVLQPGNIPIALNGSATVTPTATTTYTAIVTGQPGCPQAAQQVTVTVSGGGSCTNPPAVTAFTATPSTIQPGGVSTLTLASTNGTAAVVQPGNLLIPLNGSIQVSPAQTTAYEVFVAGNAGCPTAQYQTTVTVQPPGCTNPPTILGFSANPNPLPAGGGTVTFTLSSTGGGSATIQPGNIAVPLNGTATASVTQTTTFTLTLAPPIGSTCTAATDQLTVVVAPPSCTAPPAISQFSVTPTTLPSGGGTVTFTLASANGGSAVIQPGAISIPTNGTATTTVTQTTAFTVTLSPPAGSTCSPDSATATVTVNPVSCQAPPSITSLTASPTVINAGQSSVITLASLNGVSAVLQPGNIPIALNGSATVTPTATTTYTAIVTGQPGCPQAAQQVTVTVSGGGSCTNPPAVTAFTATPSIITAGQAVTLSLSSTNGTGAVVQPGNLSIPLNGSITVAPTVTTTYDVTVAGDPGCPPATAQVTVTIQPPGCTTPPTILAFTASPNPLPAGGGTVTFTLSSTGGGSATIQPGNITIPVNGTATAALTQTTVFTVTLNPPAGSSCTAATDQVTVTVSPDGCTTPPAITGFSVSPSTLPAGGGTVTFTLASTNGGSAVIQPGNIAIPVNGTATATVTQTTAFTVTLSPPAGSTCAADTASTTVTVNPLTCTTPPSITSLTFTPSTINPGQTVTVAIASTNGVSAVLQPGDIPLPLNGTISIQPTATTTYTAEVTGQPGCPVAGAQGTVTVSGGGSCSAAPLITAFTVSPSTITPGQPVTITLASVNGTGAVIQPGNYAIDPNGSITIYPSVTTTFGVTLAGGTGCTPDAAQATVVVQPAGCTAPPTITSFTGSPNPLPSGGGTVTFTLVSANGASAVIQPGNIPIPPNGTAQTSLTQTTPYTVTLSAPAGSTCTAAVATTTIVVSTGSCTVLPSATVSGSATICSGASTQLSVALTGTGPWQLTWSDGFLQTATASPALRTVSPGSTTTYSVTGVTDATGCTGTTSGSATVTVRTPPTALVSGSATITQGQSTTIQAALTGTGPWQLTWSDGFTQTVGASPATRVVSPAVTTTYSVTSITDANGCVGTSSGVATITVNPVTCPNPPTVSLGGGGTFCAGDPVTLTATPGGGSGTYTTFTFRRDGTVVQTGPLATYTTTTAGSYDVTVTDSASCTGSSNVAIVVMNPLPTAALTGTQAMCAGGSATLSVALTGTGPWTITWADGFTQSTGVSPATRVVTPGATTTYALAGVSDQTGCNGISTGTATVTVDPLPTATLTGSTAVCAGGSATLEVALTGTAPWILAWADGFTQTVNASPAVRTVTPASTTTYTLSSVVDDSCVGTTSGSATVTVQPPPTATLSGTQTICNGSAANLSVALTGTGPWTILWSDGFTQTAAASPAIRVVAPGATTTYTLTSVTGATCAGTVAGSATVTVSTAPDTTITLGDATVCIGGSSTASVNPVAGATYLWSILNGSITSGQGTPNIVFTAGAGASVDLSVTITAGSCSGTGTRSVPTSAVPTATVSGTAAICNGESTQIQAALTGAGPWTVTWSDGLVQNVPATLNTITRTVSPTTTTTYAVSSITNATCTGTASGAATITVNPLPIVVITTPGTVCDNAPNNVASVPSAGAGATYLWALTNGSITSGQGTNAIQYTAGASGTVGLSVTVTNASGCTATGSTTALIEVCTSCTTPPTAAVSGTAAICAGESTQISAALTGTGPWTVVWSDGVTQNVGASPATRTVTPAVSTTYTVTGLADSRCATGTSSGSAIVTVNPVPSAVITPVTATVCASGAGSASVPNAGAGATYTWSITGGGSITGGQNTPTVSFSAPTSGAVNLNVTVTNASGCSASSSTSIPVSGAVPVIGSFTATPSAVNAGQSTVLAWNVSGATAVSITPYVGPVSPVGSLSFRPSTTTTLTITATNGCGTSTSSVTVTVNP